MFDLKTKILIVDDASTMRVLIKKILKAMGYENFVEAGNGRDALQILETDSAESKVKLVISDWNMPIATGLELLVKIRSDNRFSTLGFLMITAEADENQVSGALDAGADAYIIKPLSAPALKEKLQAIYQKRAQA